MEKKYGSHYKYFPYFIDNTWYNHFKFYHSHKIPIIISSFFIFFSLLSGLKPFIFVTLFFSPIIYSYLVYPKKCIYELKFQKDFFCFLTIKKQYEFRYQEIENIIISKNKSLKTSCFYIKKYGEKKTYYSINANYSNWGSQQEFFDVLEYNLDKYLGKEKIIEK